MLPPITFAALGTTATLLVEDDRAQGDARAILAQEIEAIDAACSRFRDDSELARVNANTGKWIPVSARFLEALEAARRGAVLTEGRVDPTVGTAMRVLGYDRDFGEVDRDGPPLRVSVERVPGWRTIEIDPGRSTVFVPTGVELDFGATAKGLCADRAARTIATVTGAGVLVSLGGDIAIGGAIGGPEREAGWVVLVADDHAAVPGSAELDGPGQRIIVRSGGVATSGTTVRRWRRGEVEVHHVVDPRTGRPAAEHWRTVSVAAASCVDANIASTASIVLGADAPAWLEARNLPARLVARDGAVVTVGGWPAAAEVAC
jgi:FAD:protein FMN transferase